MPELRVNQQSAVDTWYRRLYTDLEAGYHDTLAWSLVMMGRADAQLSRPAYRTFFNRYKDELLKAILTMIANKDDELRYSEREQKEMIVGVRKLGLDWPELDIIERSINQDNMLREEIAEFDEMPEDEQIRLVTRRSRAIRSITDPSEAVQLAAVKGYGLTIQYIENPSEAVQLAAVTENGAALQHIKDPSEAVKLAAVKDDGHAIEYIIDPSEEIQLAAVMNDPDSIGYIKDPSEKTKLAAVDRNWYAITYIKDQSPALQILAVMKNPDALEYMDYAHPEFWKDDEVKTRLITYILKNIKRGGLGADHLVYMLEHLRCPWPELKTITKSLEADNKIQESEDVETKYANRVYAGHKYKDEIDQQVTKLSREIEAGTVSLALRGAIHVLSSRYRLRDEEIGSLLSPLMPALTARARRFLEGKAISIAIRDLKELQNIGLMTDELRSSVNDNKDAIMKFLLSIIREKQNTNHTMRYIEFLEAVGIDWPEFGVIRKTAEAEFRDLRNRREEP